MIKRLRVYLPSRIIEYEAGKEGVVEIFRVSDTVVRVLYTKGVVTEYSNVSFGTISQTNDY